MTGCLRCVALIPARAGSKRCPGKNTRLLAGHPLLAYTIAAARDSGCFDEVYVSTEDVETARIAGWYGATVIQRPAQYAADASPDIEWVRHALDWTGRGREGAFAILRPTSPFRTAETIRRACRLFLTPDQTCDTLRAVEKVTQHPGKMWLQVESTLPMVPLMEGTIHGTPYHSSPTQQLPPVYVQNGSLELCYGHLVYDYHRITGRKFCPFLTHGDEGLDINTDDDFQRAEAVAAAHPGRLPGIGVPPYAFAPRPVVEANSGGTVAGGGRV